MLTEDFNCIIDIWIKALEQYDYAQLCAKPSPQSWSLGQVYMHLIDETKYYIEQIEVCISSNENLTEEASQEAKTMFLNKNFPDVKIEGAPSNSFIYQPANKEQLMGGLINLKNEISRVGVLISNTVFRGKTKHPGLNYFGAHEWLLFAEMHLRHHLRQKKELTIF